MTNQFNYYAILGIDERATLTEIREAFETLSLSFPQESRNPETNPEYQRILHAYEVLTDPDRRATYDTLLFETTPLALKVKIQASRDSISTSKERQTIYLLINIHAPEQPKEAQQPLNLCLVMDRSTSMRGERLNFVKTAVDLLLDKLSADDLISVVSFSDRAETNVLPQPAANKQQIINSVRSISASGGTEIYQGLLAGQHALQAQPAFSACANHLILLTDGHTYGDAEQCLALAAKMAAQGIGISAFGLGNEWNDAFLDQLVAPSGGQSDFIENPAQVIDFLRKRIKGLGRLYARNMRLLRDFPQSVTVQQGFKLFPFAQPLELDGANILLGDVESRYPLSILLQLGIAPQPIETRITIPLTLSASIPAQQMRERTFNYQQQILILPDAPAVSPPPEVLEAVRMLNLNQMHEKALEDAEAGHIDLAQTRMRHLTTRLLESGQTQLAHQAHSEAERLAQMGEMSADGRKKLKYATRTLMTQALNIKSDDQM